jgi:hypothetical protein
VVKWAADNISAEQVFEYGILKIDKTHKKSVNEFGIALVEGRKVKPSVARERMPRARTPALWELRVLEIERGKMNESLKLWLPLFTDKSMSEDSTEIIQTFNSIF